MQMEQLIQNFPNQIKRAIEIGESAQINSSSVSFNHIFISGLGGSGIGGTIFSQIVADELSIPILVNKDYSLPAYIGEKSLVIICSYSGNTEETLEVLRKAKDKAGKIICITSGGAILDFAKENNYDYIVIDTEGTVNTLTSSVLFATQDVFIPTQASNLDLTGVRDILDAIRNTSKKNPELSVKKVFLVKTKKKIF